MIKAVSKTTMAAAAACGALAAAAIWYGVAATRVEAPMSPPASVAPPAADAEELRRFTALIAGLTGDAAAKGISPATLERATRNLVPDPEVITASASQPEHVRTAGEYVGLLVSEKRITAGREKLAEHADLLVRIETRYGVDRHVLVAIWGIESSYGLLTGEKGVIRSLATLAASDRRRGAFWRGELLAALAILERGDIAPERLTGSWAGAMGHTQFIPSTFQRYGVDFDGDGRRDFWGDPGDALASAANYLKASGWVAGRPWGLEVRLPERFDYALSAPGIAKPWSDWQGLGVLAAGPTGPTGESAGLALVLPAGHAGPAFLVTPNFRAILRYNNAVAYALSVGHLGDRLAGGAAFATPWPAGDKALSRTDREELQSRLKAAGHDAGEIDGILGSQTRAAIRATQKAHALPEDGHPDLRLLDVLRGEKQP